MEEVEEVVENLMHNEIDMLDLSFEFAQQAPFTTLLYQQRLSDFSEEEFATLFRVLMDAVEENSSVKVVQIDWSWLRLLGEVEQEVMMRRLGRLPQLTEVTVTGSTANTSHQLLSVFSLLRLLEGLRSESLSLRKLAMDAMGSLKVQDWLYVPRLSMTLASAAPNLQILRLENLVIPQQPDSPTLDPLLDSLATSCPCLEELHVSVSLPRQYRQIRKPLCSAMMLRRLEAPKTIKLNNWGLQHEHVMALLSLPRIVSLDVRNNPFTRMWASPGWSFPYVELLVRGRQMSLQELRGIHDDRHASMALMDLYLLLNRCGRGQAHESRISYVEYLDAIKLARAQHQGGDPHSAASNVLDALYTAVREQPPL